MTMTSGDTELLWIRPVQRAIDGVTALILQGQILHRLLDEGQVLPDDHYRSQLTQINAELIELGVAHVEARDHTTSAPPPSRSPMPSSR
jgi:hypothetical protein